MSRDDASSSMLAGRLAGPSREALEDLAREVRGRFGARLRQLVLFGSHARGEATEESDVDVLLVVDDLTGAEARAIGHLSGDLLTKYDVLVAPLAMSTERMRELRERERLLPREIDREGIPL